MTKVINNINTLIIKVENCEVSVLKEFLDVLQNKVNGFVFIANVNDSNVNYLAKCSKELIDKINCGAIVKEISIKSNGNGGGSKNFASGGGSDTTNIDNILIDVSNIIENL